MHDTDELLAGTSPQLKNRSSILRWMIYTKVYWCCCLKLRATPFKVQRTITTGNPFLGTKLLGFSIGRGLGALKGSSLTADVLDLGLVLVYRTSGSTDCSCLQQCLFARSTPSTNSKRIRPKQHYGQFTPFPTPKIILVYDKRKLRAA